LHENHRVHWHERIRPTATLRFDLFKEVKPKPNERLTLAGPNAANFIIPCRAKNTKGQFGPSMN
jgi:hypothetical protein